MPLPPPCSSAAAFLLSLDRPLVMGIVNVTADSFSDGGRFLEPKAAIAAVHRLVAEGADIVDIGAESTRPGALPSAGRSRMAAAGAGTGRARLAVAARCRSIPGIHRSWRRAIEAGASIINDVEGFRRPGAVEAVAGSDVGLVAMHMKGEPGTMQHSPPTTMSSPRCTSSWNGDGTCCTVTGWCAAGLRWIPASDSASRLRTIWTLLRGLGRLRRPGLRGAGRHVAQVDGGRTDRACR